MRELFKVRIFIPHSLRNHLRQFHSGQRRGKPSVAAQHVDARLNQRQSLKKLKNIHKLRQKQTKKIRYPFYFRYNQFRVRLQLGRQL